MNIAIILGSVRQDRHSEKVGKWVTKKIEERNHNAMLIDPMQLDLPLLDKMYKEMKQPEPKFQKLQEMIVSADGYIPITPEYNHTISGALKNTLDYCLEEYFFKPSAIVSYSVGISLGSRRLHSETLPSKNDGQAGGSRGHARHAA